MPMSTSSIDGARNNKADPPPMNPRKQSAAVGPPAVNPNKQDPTGQVKKSNASVVAGGGASTAAASNANNSEAPTGGWWEKPGAHTSTGSTGRKNYTQPKNNATQTTPKKTAAKATQAPKNTTTITTNTITTTAKAPPARTSSTSMSLARRSTDGQARMGLQGDPAQHEDFLKQRRQLEEQAALVQESSATADPKSIESLEETARATAQQANCNPLWVTTVNFVAAAKVFVFHLVTVDTILCNIATVLMTYYWWEAKAEYQPHWNGSMHFILVSFAVAMPITVALRMAFDRREKALLCIANVRSFCLHIYMAHALWDWKGSDGRANAASEFDFVQHGDQVLWHLIGMGDEMTRFLTLPTFSKPRHRVLWTGRREATQSIRVAYQLLDSVLLQHMTRLTVLAETLKSIGLSGSEISRVRQYERHLSNQLEQLRMYKVYRTPQALWAFGRIFTLLLPPFYAPAFAKMGQELGHLWLGMLFGCITATCLSTLFESVQVLEDPFTAFVTLDGIDVSEELEVLQWTQLVTARKLLFPQAPEYPLRTRAAMRHGGYDPTVHYHATPALRAQLLQQEQQQQKGATKKTDTTDPFRAEEEDDVETGTTKSRGDAMKKIRSRRQSHFAAL
ncbi:protein Hydra magnipapillata [Seminavis robusta]|uniref:Protein Hydra magnipapillata n=1 Tax=Seminavis robusta TaxID=568900 RepID=A0A9N8EJ75_9STRA|nr:protein Hydra magnipapillata [Seminavis robusta]|eukprot:Sro1187_g250520.1 protein Hydra magnipapillata (621) ;mRNA; f:30814-32676